MKQEIGPFTPERVLQLLEIRKNMGWAECSICTIYLSNIQEKKEENV